ncbi:MAG: AMP-binding protein [Holophagales bacterium]|nr:MAG: AMP-binding protein [Holophagales bacterium]
MRTVGELFEGTVRTHGDRPALRWKQDGAWQTATWAEYGARARRVARALIALGVEPRRGVAIMSYNRPEWLLADLGAILAGAIPTGIYTTSAREQVIYIARHCEAAVVVVENAAYLELFESLRGDLPQLKAIVVMSGVASRGDVLSWEDFEARGDGVPESALAERLAAQRQDDPCTLIYTSGTTGPPKAVMISHGNVTFLAEVGGPTFAIGPSDRFLSYLPLSHIAEQCISVYMPMVGGSCAYFAESLEKLPENLREVRPTIFFGVPRVWEKIQARMQAVGASSSWLRRRIAAWARVKGLAGGYAAQRGLPLPAGYGLAEKVVFSKVKERLGLDAARVCITSAAPISLGTLEYFLSLGIAICEVYGMSECTGPTTFSVPDRLRTGRAGFAIPGTELKLAEDGEVWMRGPHVFLGYYKDETATRETRDADGWLHSGDIGELDADGFLRITDRKKELLITSGGKNVAPAPIEARLKTIPGIAQAVLVGDQRNYVAALLTLDPERVAEVARRLGSPARDIAAARTCEIFRAYLERELENVNATVARYEAVRRFVVLPGELTIVGGELTPTMKLKRRVIREKYAAEIESLYN